MKIKNILSLLVLGTLLSACSFSSEGNSNKTLATDSTILDIGSSIKEIEDSINYIYDSSAYTIVNVDEDLYMSVIYDTTGKAYVESDYYNGFYINKNKSIASKYDASGNAYWSIDVDYTPMYCIEKALDLVKLNKAELTKTVFADESSKGSNDFLIKIKGSNIKDFYNELDNASLDNYMLSYYGHKANELVDSDTLNIALTIRGTNLIDAAMFIGDRQNKTVWTNASLFVIGGVTFDDTIKNISNSDNFNDVNDRLNAEKEKLGARLYDVVSTNSEIRSMLESSIKNAE